jgi:hypothetical protein
MPGSIRWIFKLFRHNLGVAHGRTSKQHLRSSFAFEVIWVLFSLQHWSCEDNHLLAEINGLISALPRFPFRRRSNVLGFGIQVEPTTEPEQETMVDNCM